MSGAPRTGACILVVEDHAGIRAMAVRTLRARGYEVLDAHDGRHALEVAAACNSSIDLLVTDMEMPYMGGLDLARELAELRPGLRVLFVSGNRQIELPAQVHFLQKPYTPATLAAAVRDVLDAPA
ncbi:MAG: response regulator [Acidobacteriia bacterium]|nr:response regulator [Terriglobia bacterium]